MIIQGNDPYTQPSFSFRNRLGRALWHLVWVTLFRPSPRPLHAWRVQLLRLFGAKVGKHVHVYPTVQVWAPWNLELADFVGVGNCAQLYCMGKISLRQYATVSQGAHLCAGSHDFNSSNFQLVIAPIVVGERVWVCADAFIAPGVSIAEGSVIAARGVVSKSITEPWKVWAGVPVQKVGVRDKCRVLGINEVPHIHE